MNQAQIEKAAGIDRKIADYMMAEKTSAARTAMSLLEMQVNRYEHAGFALLKSAVDECRTEMKEI